MVDRDDRVQTQYSNAATWARAALILGVMAIIGAVVCVFIVHTGGTGSNSQPTTYPNAPTMPTVEASASDCPNALPLNYDPNVPENGNLVPTKPGSTHAVDSNSDEIQAIKNDPRIAAAWGQKLWPGQYPDSSNWQQLVDPSSAGKCTSAVGTQLVNMVVGALTGGNIPVNENGTASPNDTNSYMGAGGVASNATPGISGDMSALIYNLPNGTQVTVLKRCANFAEQRPSYPVAPPRTVPPRTVPPRTVPPTTWTTTPPPPTTQTTPPTTETTPPTTQTTTPPPPTTETTTPPPPTTTLAPKVAAENPPAPQGGGPNDQPGPGVYRAPTEMVQPPATAYSPPPPPVVTGPSAPTRLPAPVTAPPVQQGAMPPPVIQSGPSGTTVVQAPPMTSVMQEPQ